MKVAENVYSIRYNADRIAYASDLAEIEDAINAEEKKSGRPYYLCGLVYEPGLKTKWEYAGHYTIDSNVSPNVCYKGFEGVRYVIVGNYTNNEALAMIDASEKKNSLKKSYTFGEDVDRNGEPSSLDYTRREIIATLEALGYSVETKEERLQPAGNRIEYRCEFDGNLDEVRAQFDALDVSERVNCETFDDFVLLAEREAL